MLYEVIKNGEDTWVEWVLRSDGSPIESLGVTRAVLTLVNSKTGVSSTLDSDSEGFGAGQTFEWDSSTATITLRLGDAGVSAGSYSVTLTTYDPEFTSIDWGGGVFVFIDPPARPFHPGIYNLAKYRHELAESISRDEDDEYWDIPELDSYVNRAIRFIWTWLVGVDPSFHVQQDASFDLTAGTTSYSGSLPSDLYTITGIEIDSNSYYPKISPDEKHIRKGWFMEGNTLRVTQPQTHTVTLKYLAFPAKLVAEGDTDTLPDNELRDWVVPLAQSIALYKEPIDESRAFLETKMAIQAYIREMYPRDNRVPTTLTVDLGSYDGFLC